MPQLGRIYHPLRLLLPGPVRRGLKVLIPPAVRARLDPLQDPAHDWPLPGALSGYRFKVRGPAEAQYVLAEYEPRVCAAIQHSVRPGMVCVDVGANIGYLTLLLAHCSGPGGKVYAFEALPSNADQARENVRINRLGDQVCVENRAVSDGSQDRIVLYEGDSTLEFSLIPRAGHSERIEVPAIALDDYFPEGTPVGFVKVDVEGAEGRVVAGMPRILGQQRPVLLVELHGEAGVPALEALAAAGYRFTDLDGRLVSPAGGSATPSHVIATLR